MIPIFEIVNKHGFRFLQPAQDVLQLNSKGLTVTGFYIGTFASAAGHLLMIQKITGDVLLVSLEASLAVILMGHHFGELLSITCIEEPDLAANSKIHKYSVVGVTDSDAARNNIPNRISLENYIPPKYTPPEPA